MDADGTPRKTRVIAVGNQKGGVGKTTNTVHLATALGELGRRCLVWDLDVNCGSTQHFGIPDNMAILGTYEVLMGAEQPEEVIVRQGDLEEVELPGNLDLLPARRNLEFIDQALVGKFGRFTDLGSVLKAPLATLRGKYDYIFLDTAPNLTTPTIAAYKSADCFLLSAMPETFAVQGLNNALRDIQSVREHGGNPQLTLVGIILSNVDGRLTRLARELLRYVEDTFAETPPWMRKYETTVSRTTIIPAAQKLGKTIFQVEPRHKVTDQFRSLAREFEARMKMLDGKGPEGRASDVPQPDPAAMSAAQPTPIEDGVDG
ncbi:MAG: ParA family protein [Planctomycetaceae bacterium]|jgi:chromosome partitioning protein|nr:ParA family protein [Planctomycetaceae bacterium]